LGEKNSLSSERRPHTLLQQLKKKKTKQLCISDIYRISEKYSRKSELFEKQALGFLN